MRVQAVERLVGSVNMTEELVLQGADKAITTALEKHFDVEGVEASDCEMENKKTVEEQAVELYSFYLRLATTQWFQSRDDAKRFLMAHGIVLLGQQFVARRGVGTHVEWRVCSSASGAGVQ